MSHHFLEHSDEHKTVLLQLEKVKKQIHDFTLLADFTIEAGERAVLLGKSGIGKTTFLRFLAGLEPWNKNTDSGRVLLGGKDITLENPQDRQVGFIFQDQALFNHLNVYENVTFGLKMRGISKQIQMELALSWLDKVGLKSRMNAFPGELSGGEQQRVAFIRALIWKPKLLLLDEPFSSLDSELRQVLRSELKCLHQLWPVPLILVTHDEMDVELLATTRLRVELESTPGFRRVCRS